LPSGTALRSTPDAITGISRKWADVAKIGLAGDISTANTVTEIGGVLAEIGLTSAFFADTRIQFGRINSVVTSTDLGAIIASLTARGIIGGVVNDTEMASSTCCASTWGRTSGTAVTNQTLLEPRITGLPSTWCTAASCRLGVLGRTRWARLT